MKWESPHINEPLKNRRKFRTGLYQIRKLIQAYSEHIFSFGTVAEFRKQAILVRKRQLVKIVEL